MRIQVPAQHCQNNLFTFTYIFTAIINWFINHYKLSNPDNAFLAFSLIRWISVTSVIPTFDHIVAHQREANIRRQKNERKRRFREMAIYKRNTANYGQSRPSSNRKIHKVQDEIIL